ncbi:hypothetical protein M6B38_175175 [Iris pallida]|uniref:Uncharacterized protein n=1 Tax=Iris pallida TaxID=29817 RepID=A0AAX6EQS8_IRIPA|nr:hypothetical protein M6B38_175175 [Iris pallida]
MAAQTNHSSSLHHSRFTRIPKTNPKSKPYKQEERGPSGSMRSLPRRRRTTAAGRRFRADPSTAAVARVRWRRLQELPQQGSSSATAMARTTKLRRGSSVQI